MYGLCAPSLRSRRRGTPRAVTCHDYLSIGAGRARACAADWRAGAWNNPCVALSKGPTPCALRTTEQAGGAHGAFIRS